MSSNRSEIKIKWKDTYIFLPDKTLGALFTGELYKPKDMIVIHSVPYTQWNIEDVIIHNEGKGGMMRNIYLKNN